MNQSPSSNKHPLSNFLIEINDPRSSRHILYPIEEIFFLLVVGSLSGCDELTAIQAFGEEKEEWLRKYYPYKNGIPSHDTLGRVLSLVNYQSFEELFVKWVAKHFDLAGVDLIHLDGKRLRGSANKDDQTKDKSTGVKYVEIIVNAYASGAGLVLAQNNVSNTNSEVHGALQLLEWLDISGCCITADANFCRTSIIDKVVSQKADYLLTLKGNWPKMLEHAKDAFSDNEISRQTFETNQKGRGRQEHRVYRSITEQDLPPTLTEQFKGIKQVVEVTRSTKVIRKDMFQQQTHYYITSLDQPLVDIASKIRQHWLIENQLHYVLDVSFGEDRNRTRTKNAATNYSLIRKVSFNLLKQSKLKGSIKTRRLRCAISDKTRDDILK